MYDSTQGFSILLTLGAPKGKLADLNFEQILTPPLDYFSGAKTRKALLVAEREGFEPSVGLTLRLISSQVHSTTLPPLRTEGQL